MVVADDMAALEVGIAPPLVKENACIGDIETCIVALAADMAALDELSL